MVIATTKAKPVPAAAPKIAEETIFLLAPHSPFPLCELSPRVSLSTLETLKNVVSIRSEERKFRRKDWLDCARCCATFPSLLFFLEIRMTLLVEKFGVIHLFKMFLWDEWEWYVSLVICAIYSRERRFVLRELFLFLVSNNIW